MANTPNVRFKGFTDDWEQYKFSDFTWASGKRNKEDLDLEPYAITNEHGFIPQKEAHDDFGYMKDTDRKAYNIVTPNSFAYNPARINVGSIGYYEGTENVIVSSLYEVFQTVDYVDNRFLWHWFKSDEFPKWIERLQEGSVRLYFYYDKLCECRMLMPSVAEQKKIAMSLDHLDHSITLHQRKCDEVKQLKKFMLQKMFPKSGELIPEIRFAGFTDDWKQRKLGEVVEIKDSARIPNAEWSDFGVPYIRASDITNEDTQGELFITFERYEFYKNKTGAPSMGDVLFNGGGEIGKTLLKMDDKPIYVQGGAVLYARTSVSKALVGQYLKTYFETEQAKNHIYAASAGGTMKHFTLKPSQEMPVMLPTIEEQRKIGIYFSHFDDLITLYQRMCDELKKVKRFMLQNMFPQKG